MKRTTLTILIAILGILACVGPALAGAGGGVRLADNGSGAAVATPGSETAPADPNAQPNIMIPNPLFTFESVVDGAEVVHDFLVYNRGTGALAIEKVQTG